MRKDESRTGGEGPELEQRIDEALAARAQGGQAALEQWLNEHPSSAELVREHLARLDALGLLDERPAAALSRAQDRLGGFRLLERLGEGGMGLVWIAEETALGRRVALKMIRPEHLWFEGARERFRREVEAVARLQHPGIVPVYAAGEEGGLPFFTMELVDGCTLSDVLRHLRGRDPASLTGLDLARALDEAAPAPPAGGAKRHARGPLFEGGWTDACIQIARQIAEALDHAHGRGFVHRDVKPSNVALTRSGRAMLFDFGLARSGEAERMTRSASQPGSLPYMAPEQVVPGGAVDARSDLYSLGATLYELLTLHAAFDAPSPTELARKIGAGELERPRARVPSLAWDVETVCLKTLAADPRRRYASADDLARDLGNLLARRPIEARRAGLPLRVLRWAQRNPRASAAVLAAVPLVLVALGALAWVERARGREVRDANRALEDSLESTRREWERAEANYEDALAAVDRLLTRLADERLEHVPHLEDLRRELYQDALTFYERLAERRSADPALRRELARARIRMAPLLTSLGRNAEIDLVLGESIAILEACLSEAPGDEELRRELAIALELAGAVYNNLGLVAEREAGATRALALWRELLAARPESLDYRLGVASALKSLAQAHVRSGRRSEAEERFREALALAREDATRRSAEAALLHARVASELGQLLLGLARAGEAEELLREALELVRSWAERRPEQPALADAVTGLLHPLARAALARGDAHEALELWTRQREVAEKLARDFPATHTYHDDLLRALANQGVALAHLKRFEEAEAVFRRAHALAETNVASLPQTPFHHFLLAQVRLNLAESLMRQERYSAALELLERGLPEADAYAEGNPQDPAALALAAGMRAITAENLIGIGEHAEAARRLRETRGREASPVLRFNAVILFARCAELARGDESLAEEEGEELASEYEAETLETLRWAVEGGFRDLAWLEEVSALDPLRTHPRFEELVRPLRAAR